MKNFIINKFRKHLTWKILIVYIVIILMPSIAIGASYYLTLKKYIVDKEIALMQNRLNQCSVEINEKIKSLEKISNQIQQHSIFIRFLRGEYSGSGSQSSVYISDLHTMFVYATLSSSYIEEVKVYMTNDSLLEMGNYLYNIRDIYDSSVIENNSFDIRLTQGYWSYNTESKSISFKKIIKDITTNKVLGILEISCNEDIIWDVLNTLQDDNVNIKLFYDNEYRNLNEGIALNNKKAYSVFGDISRLSIMIEVESSSVVNNNSMIFSLVLTLSCFIILSLSLFLIVFRLSRRITKFAQSIGEDMTSPPRSYVDKGYDELSQLIKTYNDLIANNDFLFNQVKIEKLHKEETEYRALQSQIDPHFIHNTLEGIRMMAEMHDETDIADIIFSFSKLLRYAFSISESEVDISLELDNAIQYINVQKMRIGDKIKLEIDCDDEAKHVCCPKFIIQPLVENAIKYGFSKNVQIIEIYINAQLQDNIFSIKVSNSGEKIAENKIYDINKILSAGGSLKNLSSGNGIGLDNVNRRMRYLHRESFTMQINNDKQGVSVSMSWNIMDKQESIDSESII